MDPCRHRAAGRRAVQLYINGVSAAAGSISSTTNITGTYLGARQYNSATDQFFAGQIDEVRVWQTALAAAQVRDYMNQSLAGDEPGLAAYYRMDYGTANGVNVGMTTLYDITANTVRRRMRISFRKVTTLHTFPGNYSRG